jgi:DNA helicase HerA-like ATPase
MGQRGCGKSHLAKGIQTAWPRRVIIDSLNEYEIDGAFEVHSFDEFSQKMLELKEQNIQGFNLIYRFDPESPLHESEFNEILRVCYYFRNLQIVIEEVQFYSSPHDLPHWLKTCLMTGRHQNVSLLFTTQRPGQLNKAILSQCAHIFCGKIVEGNDVKYIASFLRQDAEKLVNLPDRRFLYFSKSGIQEINNDVF